jgi:diguanylate cyclase (GGDEF)-like protein/PAS domain S-box-containing protein
VRKLAQPTARTRSDARLRLQLDEARATLRAIQDGGVDALVINSGNGEEVRTVSGADRPYRLMVEGMSEGTMTISGAGTVLYVNRRLCDMLGVTSEALVGSRAASMAGDASRVAWNKVIRLAAEPAPAVRLTLRTSTGVDAPVRVSSSTFELDGHFTNSLVITDISAEERADGEIRFQAQLLEAAGEAIIATDAVGVITYANRAAEALYGWSHLEMIGQPSAATTMPDEYADRAETIVTELRTGRRWTGDLIRRRKDGTPFCAHVTATPLLGDGGALTAIIAVSSDVTDRVEAERILALHAGISERIAADAPVADVLDAIAEIAVGDGQGARVSYIFNHPDFQLDTRIRPGRRRSARTAIEVDKTVVGAMLIEGSGTGDAKTPFSALRASRAVHLAALVAQREISKERLSRQALHDPLTNLANRTLLADRIGRSLAAPGVPPTLLIAGVDNFKLINDALGHEVGDRLLQCLAGRFGTATEPADTLARFGGDEFAILVRHPTTELSVVALAEQLSRIAQEPIIIGDHDLHVTVSIGIAAHGATSETPAGLMASADSALDEAKRAGRNRIVMSGADSRRRVEDRLALEQELRAGIPRGELVGYLQPVINLASGRIAGAEILVRWQHPTRGLLQPGEFVPWAEETDLVHAIGTAMLEAACNYLSGLPEAERFVISVNAAAREIVDPGYADRTLSVLRRHRLPGSVLGVEVTESVAIAEMDAVQANLTALRFAGVTIYLDDFGTGYSSLGYLRQLPVDVLKIDRSFVTAMTTDPRAAEVVAAVAAMARALSLTTIAEGVETTEQAEALAVLGIDRGQGYLFARPQPVDEFSTWRAAQRPRITGAQAPVLSVHTTPQEESLGEIVAAGDVARSPHEPLGPRLRVAQRQRASGEIIDPHALRVGTVLNEAARNLLVFVQGTRALHHAGTIEEVVETCCSVVRSLGGTVVPARIAGANALAVELSFGQGEPLLPIAPTKEVRDVLETLLPDLLEDARTTASRLRRTRVLANEATVDGLTGLLNRRSVDRILARINAGDVILLMDLDDFKLINDRLGHAAGDLVLTSFGRVLRKEGRASDRIGRLGGDEFVAILPGASFEDANRLLVRCRATWELLRPHPVSFSAGAAMARGRDPAEVLAVADRALYKDKNRRSRRPPLLTVTASA